MISTEGYKAANTAHPATPGQHEPRRAALNADTLNSFVVAVSAVSRRNATVLALGGALETFR